jgi:peptidoglycan/xylan/chitin deacetylase (PgdA/CDA1 family)
MDIRDRNRRFKVAVLRAIRACGGFALARRLTRKRLRILCFHGGSVIDEHVYSPGLFTSPATFARRMRILQRSGLPVVPLGEAVELLERGGVDAGQTVITFDDGWKTTFDQLIPIASRYGFPVTVYVTTASAEDGREVFPVTLAYMLWAAEVTTLTIDGPPGLAGTYELGGAAPSECDLPPQRRAVLEAILRYAEGVDRGSRDMLLRELAGRLRIDTARVFGGYRFCIASPAELRAASVAGVDLQLHTHSHRSPPDRDEFLGEVRTNREVLRRCTDRPVEHFCYPSGVVHAGQPQWLAELGIRSSTTTRHDFNLPTTPRQQLNRYLDLELNDDVEFEAELAGVLELMRRAREFPARLLPRGRGDRPSAATAGRPA